MGPQFISHGTLMHLYKWHNPKLSITESQQARHTPRTINNTGMALAPLEHLNHSFHALKNYKFNIDFNFVLSVLT